MNEAFRSQPEFKEKLDYVRSITPGRLYSEPDDIAGLAVFLASDDGIAMHGATVIMDEGNSTGI